MDLWLVFLLWAIGGRVFRRYRSDLAEFLRSVAYAMVSNVHPNSICTIEVGSWSLPDRLSPLNETTDFAIRVNQVESI